MATLHDPRPVTTAVEVDIDVHQISWGAIFAGVVVTLALQMLLSLLGIGLGFTTIDPTGTSPGAASLGIGAGIWWVITSLIAVFAGGYVAGRLGGAFGRSAGMLHGLVVWAVGLLATFWLLTSAVGSVIGGAYNVIGGVASTATQAAAQAVPDDAGGIGIPGIDIEAQLRQLMLDASPEDVGTLSPEQAQEQLLLSARQFIQGGENAEAARERIVAIIASQTNMSEEQVQEQVAQWEARLQQAQDQVAQTAETASNAVATGAIMAAIALMLGAAMAAWGGMTGARRLAERRDW